MVPLERVEERRGKISSIPQDQLFFFCGNMAYAFVSSQQCPRIPRQTSLACALMHVFYFTPVVPYEHFTEPLKIYD